MPRRSCAGPGPELSPAGCRESAPSQRRIRTTAHNEPRLEQGILPATRPDSGDAGLSRRRGVPTMLVRMRNAWAAAGLCAALMLAGVLTGLGTAGASAAGCLGKVVHLFDPGDQDNIFTGVAAVS